jgi:SAM-dependent methyltransferase
LSSDPRLPFAVIPLINSAKGIFLDVGCGFGTWGLQIRRFSCPSYLIGVDIWKPYLIYVKRRRIYDDLVLADATKLPFKEKSIDVSLACEIIEHLTKKKIIPLLASLESLCRHKIVISTPNYHISQDEIPTRNMFPLGITLFLKGKVILCEV